ncbi:MAG: CotH kinase family protein [Fibromonadales bacterium]|nr:CotH kinase family protein [Fibromonadales bacterium]
MRYNTLKLALAAVLCLSVIAVAQIPTIRITTKNNQEPTVTQQQGCFMNCSQTMNYVSITNFELNDQSNPRNNLTLTPEPQGETDSVRVRGNSTAGSNKKPYRIKFDKKQSLFGKEKAKSWVLIANYYDYTFCLNAAAFELGRAVGLEFTNSYEFVDVYINSNYKGIYMLTEQMQAGAGRVNIDAGKDKGWLIEMDYHPLDADQVGFTAPSPYENMGNIRIREPELGGCDTNPLRNCNINNDTVRFVQTEVNAMFSGVNSGNYSSMDLESWAKYVLVQQFMDNFDFNSKVSTQNTKPGSNYAYKDAGGKIKAGPLWDFDLAAGVQDPGFMMQNWPKHYVNYTEPIRPRNAFYQKMWSDPVFTCHLKKAWTDNKSKFSAVTGTMDNIANKVKSRAQANFSAYTDGMAFGDTRPNSEATYTAEVAKLKSWWNSRVNWFDTEVNKLTTSVTNCNSTTPSSSSVPSSSSLAQSSSSSSLAQSSSSLMQSSSSSSVQSSSSNNNDSNPFVCSLSNSSTTGTVNVAVQRNVFVLRCNEGFGSDLSVESTSHTWGNLTPTSVGDFNITVTRSATANGDCKGRQTTCTIPIVNGTSPIALPKVARSNAILAIKNGVELQATNSARIEVYNLGGKLEKTMNFASGVYSVSLSDMPKGMYIVKVSFGSEKRILRLPVR